MLVWLGPISILFTRQIVPSFDNTWKRVTVATSLISFLRYVATGVPSNTLMPTAPCDITDLDAWMLSDYRRPKQSMPVDEWSTCRSWSSMQSLVPNHPESPVRFRWSKQIRLKNTELPLCASSLRSKDSQNIATGGRSRLSGSSRSSGFGVWDLKICDRLTFRIVARCAVHDLCTGSLVFDQISGS